MICKEILDEIDPDDPDRAYYATFYMSVYAFPNPKQSAQKAMIRSLGYIDNVAASIKIVSPDWVTLQNIRREYVKLTSDKREDEVDAEGESQEKLSSKILVSNVFMFILIRSYYLM